MPGQNKIIDIKIFQPYFMWINLLVKGTITCHCKKQVPGILNSDEFITQASHVDIGEHSYSS